MLTLKAIVNGILAISCLALMGMVAFVKFSRNRIHSAGVSYMEARQYVERKTGERMGIMVYKQGLFLRLF